MIQSIFSNRDTLQLYFVSRQRVRSDQKDLSCLQNNRAGDIKWLLIDLQIGQKICRIYKSFA